MSTSEQGVGQLTRKQLRERRLTEGTATQGPPEGGSPGGGSAPAAPLPRAAEPVVLPEVPSTAPAQPETPLTRRQIREQERVRTASVPLVPEHTPTPVGVGAPTPSGAAPSTFGRHAAPAYPTPSYESPAAPQAPVSRPAPQHSYTAPVVPQPTGLWTNPQVPVPPTDVEHTPLTGAAQPVTHSGAAASRVTTPDAAPLQVPVAPTPEDVPPLQRPEKQQARALTHSYDDLVGQDGSGSSSSPNALIFAGEPGIPSLSGPIGQAGQVLVTGSYDLPMGLGSTGSAPGTTDGKEADAVLIDNELPPTSSPTPIAASSAISTIKPAAEVIRPPQPDKGNRMMLALTITAGGLALALVGVVVVAFTTGVFS
ncbi:hypothetical protein [Microbacterium sp. YY-01]|uniref:hypothetical protein n=1 Tax=Microbacterium sp. YY-01 TaxID=3421634 RepID=UPI003D1701D1